MQFRSILPELSDLSIDWYYLAEREVAGERRRWLGRPLSTGQFVSDLFARSGFLPGSTAAVRTLVTQMDADIYWVVTHNEGLSVAAELCAQGKRVHLSVHDDPVCLFRRSRKLRALAPLMSRQLPRVLRACASVDVISENMQERYRREYGVNSFPVFRYLRELPVNNGDLRADTLRIGHIGSLYHAEPFRLFVAACVLIAAEQKRALKIRHIGSSPELEAVARENPGIFEACGELSEPEAIHILSSCDFVYAMYPEGSRFECFRRTSLPMKLSTYTQAQRPIFAHTPDDSTLAQTVARYRVGVVCTAMDGAEIRASLDKLAESRISREHFEALRVQMMGSMQIEELRKALTGNG